MTASLPAVRARPGRLGAGSSPSRALRNSRARPGRRGALGYRRPLGRRAPQHAGDRQLLAAGPHRLAATSTIGSAPAASCSNRAAGGRRAVRHPRGAAPRPHRPHPAGRPACRSPHRPRPAPPRPSRCRRHFQTSCTSCSATSTARSPTTTRSPPSRPRPAGATAPAIWLLGSSDFGAIAAGMLGLPFSFAHHFASGGTDAAVATYREHFRPSQDLDRPHLMLGVSVICARRRHRRLARRPSRLSFLLRSGRPQPTPEEAAERTFTPMEKEILRPWSRSAIAGDRRPRAAGARRAHRRRRADGHRHGPATSRLPLYRLLADLAGRSAAASTVSPMADSADETRPLLLDELAGTSSASGSCARAARVPRRPARRPRRPQRRRPGHGPRAVGHRAAGPTRAVRRGPLPGDALDRGPRPQRRPSGRGRRRSVR